MLKKNDGLSWYSDSVESVTKTSNQHTVFHRAVCFIMQKEGE